MGKSCMCLVRLQTIRVPDFWNITLYCIFLLSNSVMQHKLASLRILPSFILGSNDKMRGYFCVRTTEHLQYCDKYTVCLTGPREFCLMISQGLSLAHGFQASSRMTCCFILLSVLLLSLLQHAAPASRSVVYLKAFFCGISPSGNIFGRVFCKTSGRAMTIIALNNV